MLPHLVFFVVLLSVTGCGSRTLSASAEETYPRTYAGIRSRLASIDMKKLQVESALRIAFRYGAM